METNRTAAQELVGPELTYKLSQLDWEAVNRALAQAQGIERGTRVNPKKDRSLRGKARIKARRAAR